MAILETDYTALTGPQGMFRFKADMVAGGWAVAISSDGTTYNGSGDQITTNGTGAGGINNANAYFLLRRTGAPDWLITRGADGDNWSIFSSTTAAFAGGNATTRPTAGDEYGQFSPFTYQMFTGTFDVEIRVEDTSPFRWAIRPTYDTYYSSIGAVDRVVFLYNLAAQGGFFNVATFDDQDAWLDVESMLAATSGGGGGPSDTTDPVISAFTPSPGAITRAATIAVDVTDETALGPVVISAELADGTVLHVYDGGAFVGPFAASSTAVGDTWTIEHDAPGWPSSTVDIHVLAVDAAGNSATATGSFTITDAPAAPAIGPFSPTDGGNTTRTGTVTIDVTDDEGRTAIALVTIAVTLADGTTVTAYNGAAFPGALAGGSSRSDITDGYRYTLVHASPGWASSTLAYRITAVDTQGRVTTHTTYNLVVTDPPAPVVPDTTAPVVTFTLANGTEIGRNDAVPLDVTDETGLAAVIVMVLYPDTGEYEVAHDGTAFAPRFVSKSTRAAITDGYHFELRRTGGWLSPPTVKVLPLDTSANEG